jgi:hypothetical protein
MTCYQDLADRVLKGTSPTRAEALEILATPQGKLLDLVNAPRRLPLLLTINYFGCTH